MSDNPRAIDVPSPAWQLNTGKETETVKDSVPSKEDKVALAMKLVEEAQERAAAKAEEEQKKAERVALAKKLADEARARAASAKAKKAAPAPKKRKKMTAQEALAAAIAAEEDTQPAQATKQKAPSKKRKKAPAPTEAQAKPAAQATSDADPSATLLAALGDVNVESAGIPVSNPTVFAAVWSAHASRARHEGDLQMVALATLLVRSAQTGTILAWRIESNETTWAVWTDESGHVLGSASPADIYLAGT